MKILSGIVQEIMTQAKATTPVESLASSVHSEQIQPSPLEEKSIRQSNIITTAQYDMSSLEKNILYMVLSQIKRDDLLKPNRLYAISTAEMSHLTGSKLKKSDYLEALDRLITRSLTAVEPSGNVLKTSFIASAYYIENKGVIQIELSHSILPYYIDIKQKFTTFQIKTALNLSSKYSKRLYELCSMHKNFSKPEFTITITDLKRRFNSDNAIEGFYPNYTNFKKNVIDRAINEINGSPICDIRVHYTEVKERYHIGKGRKGIIALVFRIEQLATGEPALDESTAYTQTFQRLIGVYKLTQKQARVVLTNFSIPDINRKLYEIDVQKINGKIQSMGGYTARCFSL